MSKTFLGISFAAAGLALWGIDVLTAARSGMAFAAPLCAGVLLGAGGILFIWALNDHLLGRTRPTQEC